MSESWEDAEEEARRLDSEDPLASFRDRFHVPPGPDGKPAVYLCGNSLGLMPRDVPGLVSQELADWAQLAVDAHFRGATPWYGYHESVRQPLARLVGAHPHEVVAMNSLTVNLHLMMASFFRPQGERRKILIESAAFPSDGYAVRSQLQLHGLDPEGDLLQVGTPRQEIPEAEILDTLERRGSEIALVLLSAVHYFTGQLFDLAAITRAAHAQGCIVGFDLAHAAGNVPLALHASSADFACWCSYKYLNAGPGAVAGCFVHERHGMNPAIPRMAGWWGNDPRTRFQMHREERFVPTPGADGWQLSNPPILALAPLRASLALFDEAGMDRLRAKSEKLTGLLERLLRPHAAILTPSDPARRGCQLSLRVGGKELFQALEARGFVTDFREPDVIRVAPVPLYNTFHEVVRFARALALAERPA
ncbi:MAG TPA: kynureninase [Candidatus Polarisedimenticolaceae bacterium]|nr:kynureninase [Candidatus Polarisedimenticolaceae bacterium]